MGGQAEGQALGGGAKVRRQANSRPQAKRFMWSPSARKSDRLRETPRNEVMIAKNEKLPAMVAIHLLLTI